MGQTRRELLLAAPVALVSGQAAAQVAPRQPDGIHDEPEDTRLPNGKSQQDEILKSDYQRNLQEARDLIDLARSFEEDLERDDRFVLSLNTLKKLDNMESTIKRIRGRLKKN